MQRGEMNADPIQAEFFSPRGLVKELVREAIQNSMDAKVGLRPVNVRFRLSDPKSALSPSAAAKYLNGLSSHLEASGFHALTNEPMGFLTIEDFGTHGLRGNPEQDFEDSSAALRNDFYYFWRNVGRSEKSEGDRGRWGLGKTIFPASSRINTFWGLTQREQSPSLLLMGQSVLKIHRVGTARYCPYGYFGQYGADDPFAAPVTDSGELERFRADFRLSRSQEPGLSIVVPYFREEEFNFDEIVRATILQYFYPLLAGELEVEVAAAEGETRINASTITDITRRMNWTDSGTDRDGLLRLFELALWSIEQRRQNAAIELAPAGTRGAPRWSEDLFREGLIEELRSSYEKGFRITVKVPLHIERKQQPSQVSYFHSVFQKDDTARRGEDYYVRQGITISEINMLGEQGVRGIVIVDDSPLSALLGDAENPAHTDWQERSAKVKERYNQGASRVRFVKQSLRYLVSVLSRPPLGRDENLLADLFHVDIAAETAAELETRRRRGRHAVPQDDKEPLGLPVPRKSPIRIDRISGGFRIAGGSDLDIVGSRITVTAAYDVRKGNPFGKYDPLDFDFGKGPIKIRAIGAKLQRAEQNRLSLLPSNGPFEVEVTGFDENRDLRIRTRREVGQ
jgi:hypothetical protein